MDNPKNNVFTSNERPTERINGSVGVVEKKVSINFSKTNKNFCLSLYCSCNEK